MPAIVLLASKDRPQPGRDAAAAAPQIAGAERFDSVADAVRDSSSDIVLLAPDATMAPGWARQLADAAEVDDRVATVSALALHGPAAHVAGAAERVRAASLRLRPALSAPAGPCVLLRREALELVGWPDAEAGDDATALATFAAACTGMGMLHVLADDVLATTGGQAGTPLEEGEADQPDGGRAGEQDAAPLTRARGVARRAVGGLSVTVDARLLDGPLGGSQIHTLALIEALATAPGLRLRVLLGPEVRHDARTALARLELDTLTYDEAIRGVPRSDVVHRPMQVFTHSDMALLRLLGERIVVTYHDGILFHNRDYFASETLWRSYRRTTSQALAEADRVVFSTRHARDEALRDELVTPQRAAVLALGTDHHVPRDEGTAPAAMPADEAPFLLCLGSDLRHKNRPFAIRLARALRKLGWSGRLVLAGARAAHGSSAARERKLLADWPGAADTVVTLDHVSEAEREWLMSRCAAVVFASVSEGFGLPPFEAARRGVPCLFAPRSAMAELLPLAASTIVPWDAEASAQGALAVLADTAQRARHLELLRDAAQPLTWRHFADGLIGVYEAAARSPRRAVSALVAQADERERDLRALDELTIDLRARIAAIGPDAMRLVGPDGLLPPDIQRALLAAVARRPGRAGLFALLRAGYRFGHRGQ